MKITSSRNPGQTSGTGLFYDELTGGHRLVDIRFALEKKLAACLACGGTNGYPIQPYRVKNPEFRSLVAAGMLLKKWTLIDLTKCTDRLDCAASLVLIASLEKPVWGQADYLLFEALETMEELQNSAVQSGRTL